MASNLSQHQCAVQSQLSSNSSESAGLGCEHPNDKLRRSQQVESAVEESTKLHRKQSRKKRVWAPNTECPTYLLKETQAKEVFPRRRSSGKSLSTRCSAVQTEPHRCHKIQSMTAVKTDQQVSTEPTKRKQAIESQSSRKVLLRRPTKKISGSRITNQVYLSPDEY